MDKVWVRKRETFPLPLRKWKQGFFFFFETGSHFIVQAGFQFPGLSDLPSSASRVAETDTIVMYHYTWSYFNYFVASFYCISQTYILN
jgi:hypothetical protein